MEMSAGQKLVRRRKVEERVDISDLQFGEDFQDAAEAMLNAEVKAVIDTVNAAQELEFDDLTEMMQNTSKFVETFGKFQDTESISRCKQELMERGLHSFEAASMGNLMPTNADEAKRLIASLTRLSDDDVRECCSIVQRYREV
uniref:RNA polymerase Rpb4/RPC9 core domain-containing protein n=1 Tax=Cryptomonas curvata TaxID=233186 RepID=A0A7S0MZZ5_9CRYP